MSTDPARLTIVVDADADGHGGLIQVSTDLHADIDGDDYPLVRWDLPLFRAQALLDALTALDDIGEVMAACNGEGPNLWPAERSALTEAIEHLITTGRAVRTPHGFLNVPPAEGEHPL